MLKMLRLSHYFHHHRLMSIIAGHVIVMTLLALVLLGSNIGKSLSRAFASMECANGEQSYTVQSGDTLSAIAGRYQVSLQQLANHNQIVNSDLIFAGQELCIPGTGQGASADTQNFSFEMATRGQANLFPYAQCTWWASQRFYQLHGIYVPWATNANAWQWTARAYDFHWHVSSQPTVGAIVDLQPWVQGAFDLGHVAVVEQILDNGDVLASNMNWAGNGPNVVNVEFTPGPGVTFISV